jgi:enoyl-CoA hydratase
LRRPGSYDAGMPSEILTESDGPIGMVRINRPEASNALNQGLVQRLAAALQRFDHDADIRCMLLLGHERAFATGADVAELIGASLVDIQERGPLARWDELDRLRKPVVAAVCGYALGTGCELVLACDIVVAAETARFGQPELTLGIIPGAGGTQRLTRVLGKARAMDLILTGRMITAREALQMGLVSRVVPRENCEEEARAVCRELCRRPPLALRAAKEAVRKAFETTLSEGLAYERQLLAMLFATDDQKEGMRAFLEKRPPIFAGR